MQAFLKVSTDKVSRDNFGVKTIRIHLYPAQMESFKTVHGGVESKILFLLQDGSKRQL